MKKIYGFAFAAAVMALASCSNENEPGNPNPAPNPDVTGPGSYLAVNIVNPAGTRADEFEVGSTNENKIQSGTFYIFDKDDKLVYTQPLDPTASWQGPADLGNTVEKIGGATMLIPNALWKTDDDKTNQTPVTAANVPTGLKVLVVLNDVESVSNGVSTYREQFTVGTDMSTVLGTITGKNITYDEAETEKFLMSNSTYVQSTQVEEDGSTTVVNNVVKAEPILTKYLVNDKDEAVNNPLNIYVERTVARLDYKKNVPEGEEWLRKNKIHLENEVSETVITPTIVGVYVHNNPENSAVFKDLVLETPTWPTGWNVNLINNEANRRSYWADMFSGIEQKVYAYDDVIDGTIGKGFSETANNTQYIKENTNSEKESTILVVAQLDFENEDGDLANIYGQFTTQKGAKNIVANTLRGLGYRIRTTNFDKDGKTTSTEIRTIDPVVGEGDDAVEQLVWSDELYVPSVATENHGNRTYLKLNITLADDKVADGPGKKEELVKIDGSTYTVKTLTQVNEVLAGIPISLWKSGYCYYYLPVTHTNAAGSTTNAVVRNHLYRVNFQGISGLGTPIFDPSKDIDPVPPMYDKGENVYLKAAINVLQWRVATQNIVLGQ